MGAHQTQRGVNHQTYTHYNEKILVRFVVMVHSVLRLWRNLVYFTVYCDLLDTLIMQNESFCYCL